MSPRSPSLRALAHASLASFCWLSVLAPSAALAHAPEARRVAVTPDGSGVALALPGFGLLVRPASATSFSYLCDAALDVPPADLLASLAYLGDGSLLFGTVHGVRVVTPGGCPRADDTSELRDAAVFALTVHTASATGQQTVYAVAAGKKAGLWRSVDGGRQWELRGPFADAEQVTSLVVHPSDSGQLYLTTTTAQQRGTLHVSTDGGATFRSITSERPQTFLLAQPSVATDAPAGAPARLWAVTRATDSVGNRGFTIQRAESPDGPWTDQLRVNYFGGLTIDPAGTLYVGDEGRGVFGSDDGGDSFTNISPDASVACLSYAGDALWACTPGTMQQRALATLSNGQSSFSDVVAFADVTELVRCEAPVDIPNRCAAAWVEWQRDVLLRDLTANDAGVQSADAGTQSADAAAAAADSGVPSIDGSSSGESHDASTSSPVAAGAPKSDGCALQAPTADTNPTRALSSLLALCGVLLALRLRRRREDDPRVAQRW